MNRSRRRWGARKTIGKLRQVDEIPHISRRDTVVQREDGKGARIGVNVCVIGGETGPEACVTRESGIHCNPPGS